MLHKNSALINYFCKRKKAFLKNQSTVLTVQFEITNFSIRPDKNEIFDIVYSL